MSGEGRLLQVAAEKAFWILVTVFTPQHHWLWSVTIVGELCCNEQNFQLSNQYLAEVETRVFAANSLKSCKLKKFLIFLHLFLLDFSIFPSVIQCLESQILSDAEQTDDVGHQRLQMLFHYSRLCWTTWQFSCTIIEQLLRRQFYKFNSIDGAIITAGANFSSIIKKRVGGGRGSLTMIHCHRWVWQTNLKWPSNMKCWNSLSLGNFSISFIWFLPLFNLD